MQETVELDEGQCQSNDDCESDQRCDIDLGLCYEVTCEQDADCENDYACDAGRPASQA